MGRRGSFVDHTQNSFLSSPRGNLTPRTPNRSASFTTYTPLELIRNAILNSRNELVMLLTG